MPLSGRDVMENAPRATEDTLADQRISSAICFGSGIGGYFCEEVCDRDGYASLGDALPNGKLRSSGRWWRTATSLLA